jgi:hypothetical protein
MTILVFIRSLSLNRIKDLFEKKTTRSSVSEMYVVAWGILLFILLWYPFSSKWLLLAVVIYRTIDAVNYRLCILFVDRYQQKWGLRSLNRSLILLLINYLELIVGFSILYLHTNSVGTSSGGLLVAPVESLYYSVVTITTLGYGDYAPITSTGQWLVMVETLLGFVLVALVVGSFLTGLKDIKELPPEKAKDSNM